MHYFINLLRFSRVQKFNKVCVWTTLHLAAIGNLKSLHKAHWTMENGQTPKNCSARCGAGAVQVSPVTGSLATATWLSLGTVNWEGWVTLGKVSTVVEWGIVWSPELLQDLLEVGSFGVTFEVWREREELELLLILEPNIRTIESPLSSQLR